MKFESIDSLVEYITQNNIPLSDVDVSITKIHACACTTDVHEKEAVIKLTSLSDSPIVEHQIIEAEENEIYVQSVDVIKDACGTGRIEIFDKSILVNVCESEGNIHVNLDLEVNGKYLTKVPFLVKLSENSKPYIKLTTNYI